MDAVAQTHVVPQSVSSPGRPAVFCEKMEYGILRSHYQVLDIYGVPADAQHVVLSAVSSAHHRFDSEAVQVVFYHGENWRTWTNKDGSVSGASRGPEKIERVAAVR